MANDPLSMLFGGAGGAAGNPLASLFGGMGGSGGAMSPAGMLGPLGSVMQKDPLMNFIQSSDPLMGAMSGGTTGK